MTSNSSSKKTEDNGVPNQGVPIWQVIGLVFHGNMGLYVYIMFFGEQISLPLFGGICFRGTKAVCLYLSACVIMFIIAHLIKLDLDKMLVSLGVYHFPFVFLVMLKKGIGPSIICFFAATICFHLISAMEDIEKYIKILSAKIRINDHIKRELKKMKFKKFIGFGFTGLFRWFGLMLCLYCYITMIGCAIGRTPVEYNLMTIKAQLSEEVDEKYGYSGADWDIYVNNDIWRDHMDIIRKLSDVEWQGLSHDEKLDVLNQICALECEYMGISSAPKVLTFEDADRPKVNGFFDANGEYEIYIKKTLLDDNALSEKVLSTLYHEMEHRYQWECVTKISLDSIPAELLNLSFFKNLRIWKEEFYNYKEIEEYGWNVYARQYIEQDARLYSHNGQWLYKLANSDDPEEILSSGRID